MSYNKRVWANGDLITKERMNNIENGIYDAHDKINTINNKVEENTTDTNTARQDISDIKLQIGTEELTTNAKEVKGAINEVNSQIKEKVNKGEGGVITNAMLSQEVKEAMTGGSVAVVGKNTILAENIVDNVISPSKTTFSIRNPQTQLFDKDSGENQVNKVIYSTGNGVIEDMGNKFVSHKIDVSNIQDGINIGASCILNGATNYLNVIAYGENDSFIQYQYRYITKTSDIKYIRISGNLELISNCVVTTDIVGHEYRYFSFIDGNKIVLDGVFLKNKFKELIELIDLEDLKIDKSFTYKGNLTSTDSIDKVLSNGFYIIQSPCSTVPNNFNSGFLLSFSDNSTMSIQYIISYDLISIRAIRRVRSSSNISDWESLIESNKPLEGKKGLCMGDSITHFGNYPTHLSTNSGGNFLNCGFGGTRLSYNDDDNFKDISFIKICEAIDSGVWTSVEQKCNEIDTANGNTVYTNSKNRLKYAGNPTVDWSDVDYILLAYGTNDFGGNVQLDDNSDEFNINTILGAFRKGVQLIQTKYPNIEIFVFTPCFRSRVNAGDNKNSDDYPNSNGVYLSQICDAIELECKKLHIPCKNMYYESRVNKYTASTYLSDGLHRTEKGYKLLAEQYEKFILSN